MPEIRILGEIELREVVRLDLEIVDRIEAAFAALAGAGVVMPPVMSFRIAEHNGEVDVKTAYVPGLDSFAVKISPGFFDNPALGLASLNGLMVLFSAHTGLVEAVLLDNGYLTDLRTAAAGAVAARWLAREDARFAGVVGAGVQARLQLEALALVRPLAAVRIWARSPERAAALAAELAPRLAIPVEPLTDLAALVAASDVLITATPSEEPLIRADWLHPGLHITALGADADYKCELDPGVLVECDRYVCDRLAQCRERGELRAAIAAGAIPATAQFPELGALVAGLAPARADPSEITVCDLTGTGVQDTAIAILARERAAAGGAGEAFIS